VAYIFRRLCVSCRKRHLQPVDSIHFASRTGSSKNARLLPIRDTTTECDDARCRSKDDSSRDQDSGVGNETNCLSLVEMRKRALAEMRMARRLTVTVKSDLQNQYTSCGRRRDAVALSTSASVVLLYLTRKLKKRQLLRLDQTSSFLCRGILPDGQCLRLMRCHSACATATRL
jgi:hypothetical protein